MVLLSSYRAGGQVQEPTLYPFSTQNTTWKEAKHKRPQPLSAKVSPCRTTRQFHSRLYQTSYCDLLCPRFSMLSPEPATP